MQFTMNRTSFGFMNFEKRYYSLKWAYLKIPSEIHIVNKMALLLVTSPEPVCLWAGKSELRQEAGIPSFLYKIGKHLFFTLFYAK